MATHYPHLDERLEKAIERIAAQCRRRRFLYCAFRFGLASLALVLLCTLFLALFSQDPSARYFVLGAFALAEAIAAWYFLYRPQRNPIDLQRAALFIDELRPELENRIVTAVEFSDKPCDEQAAWLIERLIEDSTRAADQISMRELLDPRRVIRWTAAGLLAWLALFACIAINQNLWVPSFSFLQPVNQTAETQTQTSFTVEPGNTTVRRGESPVIRVLSEQTASLVSILWRTAGEDWQTLSMDQGASPKIHFHQFAELQTEIEYQVRFDSLSSEVYHIAVWTSPQVNSIDLTYYYPDYLKKSPSEITHGGAITAIEGTKVELEIHVNKPLKSARLALEDDEEIILRETEPNTWKGTLQVLRDDVYRVELTDLGDAHNLFVPEYDITARADAPPEIVLTFPRDDLEVTSLDELPLEFKIDDDFGLASYGVQIEIAGREAIRLPLGPNLGESPQAAEGRHTLMLEDFNLEPGDLVTWAVWADDQKPGREKYETLGFPYFFEIRPFNRQFEKAVSNQSSQQQQQQEGQQSQSDQQAMDQKEILIATWNQRREMDSLIQKEFDERLTRIKTAQDGIKQKLNEEGLEGVPPNQSALLIPQINESIDKALSALEATVWGNAGGTLSEAITHMQMTHRLFLKAKPERSQVRTAQSSSSSSSSSSQQRNQSSQREMQELETKRNQNFYEQEKSVQEQREATETALNALKDLSQRQKMINEEINKLISEMQESDPEKREELKRQLERLQEEERRALEELDQAERDMAMSEMDSRQAQETSEALDDARRQMTRSMDNLEKGESQQARTASSRALRALSDAEEALERLSRDAASEKMKELQERMRAMGQREEDIQKNIEELKRRHTTAGSLREDKDLDQSREETVAEKEALAQEFRDTLEEAADLAKGAEKSQELMTRKLGDWLRETSREEIPEQIDASRELVQYGIWDPAMHAEEQIREKMKAAEKGLAEAAQGAVRDDLQGMRKALEELREVRDEERQRARLAQAARENQAPSSDQSNSDPNAQNPQGQGNPQEPRDPNASENQPSQSQTSPPGESGQGDQPQGQPQDQPGNRPNENPSQRQGQQGQGQQGQQQDQEGQQGQQGQPSGNQPSGNQRRQNGQRNGNPNGGGSWDDWLAPRTEEEMRRFLEEDYRPMIDSLRNAEALLPQQSADRDRLSRVREALLNLRRDYRNATSESDGPPEFDLLQELVGFPLALAAEELERQIQKREDSEKLILSDDDAVPEKYRKRVADYYEALSESEQ